jgi:hypothetical protein
MRTRRLSGVSRQAGEPAWKIQLRCRDCANVGYNRLLYYMGSPSRTACGRSGQYRGRISGPTFQSAVAGRAYFDLEKFEMGCAKLPDSIFVTVISGS